MTVRVLCPGERRVSVVKPAAPGMYGSVQSVHTTVVKAPAGVPNVIASLPTPAKAHHRVVSASATRGQVILKPSHPMAAQVASGATTQIVRHHQEAPPAPVPQDPRFGSEGPTPLPSAWRERLEVCSDVPVLGGGAFAEVFQVRDIETHRRFAVKVMHRPNFALRGIEKQISNEIAAMDRAVSIAHECAVEAHVVHLLDVTEEGNFVFLLMELCEGGDLLRRLYADPLGRFTESTTCVWAQQLLLGLRNIHATGILHRDIKPDNLLCNEEGMLKIADFGWCTELVEEPNNLAGTFVYMSPEVLASELQTEKVDVWSTGITLYQMLVGKPLLNTYLGPGATNLTATNPHEATNVKLRWLLEEIQTTCPPSVEQKPADLSMTCWDFLRCLLVPEVEARATVEQALDHPWLAHLPRVPNPHVLAFNTTSVIDTVMEDSDHENEELDNVIAHSPNTPEPVKQGKAGAHSPAAAHVGDTSMESLTNVPTPSKERTWDPNRNIAYSPPVRQNVSDSSELELEPAPSAPSEQLPSPNVPVPPMSLADAVAELDMTQTELSQSQSKLMDESNVETEGSPSPRAAPVAPGRLSEPVVRAPAGIETPPVVGNAGKLARSRRFTSTGCTGESPNTFESFPLVQQRMRKQKMEANLLLDQVQNCTQQLAKIHNALNTLHTATLGSVASSQEGGGASLRSTSPVDVAPGVPPIASWGESPSPRRRVCAVSSMARPCRRPAGGATDSLLATAPAFPGAVTRVPTVTPARAVRRPVRASQHHEPRTALSAQRSGRGSEAQSPNLASSATAPVWCGGSARQWQQHPSQAGVHRAGSPQPSPVPLSDRKRTSLRKDGPPPPPSPAERQSPNTQVSRLSAKSRTPVVPKTAWGPAANGAEARASPTKEVLSKTVTAPPQCMAQYHLAPTSTRTSNLGVISRGSPKGVSSGTLGLAGGASVVSPVPAPEGCASQPPPRVASSGSASLAVGSTAATPVPTQGAAALCRSTIQPVRLAGKPQQGAPWTRTSTSPAPVQYTRCAGCESGRRSSMPSSWLQGRGSPSPSPGGAVSGAA
mmetsp:Transcript_12231/g.22624  ORF Transcript_12231/g.22624 Transcript_12231/m.22624 type:complete len:1055 (-) Transcript_12231:71-3235(-)